MFAVHVRARYVAVMQHFLDDCPCYCELTSSHYYNTVSQVTPIPAVPIIAIYKALNTYMPSYMDYTPVASSRSSTI